MVRNPAFGCVHSLWFKPMHTTDNNKCGAASLQVERAGKIPGILRDGKVECGVFYSPV